MFERYTEKARRVIFFARYEASQFGSPYIEAGHMLLGLMREDKAILPRFLPRAGEVSGLEQQIRAGLEQKSRTSTSVDLPLSPLSKRVLAYGAEEAERLRHQHIDTAHLLLGLMREESNVSEILRRFGLQLDALREGVAASKVSSADAMSSLRELRNRFEEIARRLTPDVEPAVAFKVDKAPQAESK